MRRKTTYNQPFRTPRIAKSVISRKSARLSKINKKRRYNYVGKSFDSATVARFNTGERCD